MVMLALLRGCAAPVTAETQPEGRTTVARDDATPAASEPELWPAGAAFDYQLGGASTPPEGVTVVVRDSTEPPAEVGYDICYVNGFQSQPGVEWPDELLLHDDSGELLVDPGWPDEHIFDTSAPARRSAIVDRLAPVEEGCAEAGYEAVEFDNLDSYSRSQGALTLDDAAELAMLLVEEAHGVGLAAGQKNTSELEDRGRDEIGFDFAVAEECASFDECPVFADVYGDSVLDVEYADDLSADFDELCTQGDVPASTILRDRDLVVRSEDGYTYERC